MIDVRLLLDFATVGETLSFSAAARKSGVAQPRLSAQIRKLEAIMGMPLFDRTTRRVAFTPAGQQLFDLVRPAARSVDVMMKEVLSIRAGRKGRLSLGTVVLAEPDRRLLDMISGFSARHPDIDLIVEAGSPDTHLSRLEDGSLDIAVCPEVDPLEAYDRLHLHPIEFAVMMRHDDPLSRPPKLHLGDFAGRHVAVVQRARNPAFFDRYYAPLIEAGADPVYVPELRRVLLRDTPGLIVTTLVPDRADATLRHGIVRRSIEGVPPLWLTMMRRSENNRAPAAAAFWNYSRKMVETSSPARPS